MSTWYEGGGGGRGECGGGAAMPWEGGAAAGGAGLRHSSVTAPVARSKVQRYGNAVEKVCGHAAHVKTESKNTGAPAQRRQPSLVRGEGRGVSD